MLALSGGRRISRVATEGSQMVKVARQLTASACGNVLTS